MFDLLTNDKEFADHNKGILAGLAGHLDRPRHRRRPDAAAAVVAARRQAAALRGRPGPAKNRFAGILADLNLDAPKELAQ